MRSIRYMLEAAGSADESSVWLKVLGPVSATNGDSAIGLGGPKQKTVLAMLIAADGLPVSGDSIALAVYGEDAPARARRRVQTYVSTLRGIVGDVILRRGTGWVLSLDRERIDAARFEDTVVGARALAPLDAAVALRNALELWHGHPYDDVEAHGYLDAEIARLDELRLQALEARIEADLDTGRAADLLPELSTLVAQHPYRERFRAHQMVALYRAGRQQEALRSYEQLRSLLVEDLGVDPTPELLELERRVLAQDESLLVAVESTGRPLRGYRLVEQIGSGAFSIVWRGVQPSVDRDVAIKQIRSELVTRPEFIRRFEAEAQLIARIEHPYIVPLIDYWRDPESAYLVMRWLRGGTVERSLDDGPWAIERTLRMAGQIGDALDEAHSRGVIHRDVKTANVLLDERGNTFLGDFGIAVEAIESAGSEAALSLGTPAYASPEQLRRQPLAPQADIFSLGVVLYECLAGKLPFGSKATATEAVRRQLEEPFPNLTTVRSDVPGHVAEAIAIATNKKQADRFESARDFIEALEIKPAHGSRKGVSARSSVAGGEILNPYKGLRTFDETDEATFFGRERLVNELLSQLDGDGLASRCVTVVGPSGAGKSSIVRAGLVPALRNGGVTGSDDWFITTMVPGVHPFEALEAALLRVAVNPPASLVHQLRDGTRGILRGIRRCLAIEDQTVLLVIDQFEELFTAVSPEVADAFLDALSVAVEDPTSPLRVVATLRADYYDRPLAHSAFASVLKAGAIDVTPLAADELEQAITGPAALFGVDLEPGLVARLTAEATGQPAPLPLLQYTLAELFERRSGNTITLSAHDQVGGLAGSLAARADALFTETSADEKRAIRRLFGHLIDPEQATSDLRRRALFRDIAADEVTAALVDRYAQARLLTLDREASTREPTVEVAHEALLREWPRLLKWLAEDRDLLRSTRRLALAADSWSDGGHEDTDLYRAGRLDDALQLAQTAPDRLREVDRDFVAASRAAAESELALERTRVKRLRRLVAAVGAALIVALIAGAIALNQQRRVNSEADRATLNEQRALENEMLAEQNATDAQESADEANAQRLVAESAAEDAATAAEESERLRGEAEQAAAVAQIERERAEARALVASASDVMDDDAELALLLALEGAAGQPGDVTALRVLRQAMQAPIRLYSAPADPETSAFTIDMSPDGNRLVSAGNVGVEARDIATGQLLWLHEIGAGISTGTTTAQYTEAGDEVVVTVRWEPVLDDSDSVAPRDAGVTVLDAATGTVKRKLPGVPCGAIPLARRLSDDGRIAILETSEAAFTEANCGLNDIGLSEAQGWLVDVTTGQRKRIGPPRPIGPAARAITVTNPSASVMLQASFAGEVMVIDTATDETIVEFTHQPGIGVLAISDDGVLAAVGGSSGAQPTARNINIVDARTGETISTIAGHKAATQNAEFGANNSALYTTGTDGIGKAWNTQTGELLENISVGSGANVSIDAIPSGKRLAVAGAAVNVVSLDVADIAEAGVIDQCPDGNGFYITFGLEVAGDRVHVVNACDRGEGNALEFTGKVLDRPSDQLLARSVASATQGHDLSPTGDLIATQIAGLQQAPGDPGLIGTVVVTDVETGAETKLDGLCEWAEREDEPGCEIAPTLPRAIQVRDLDISADQRWVAASADRADALGIVWDLAQNSVIGQWPFFNAEFIPEPARAETNRVFTFGELDTGVGFRLSELPGGGVIAETSWEGRPPWDFVISPEGESVILIDEGDVLFLSLDTLEVEQSWLGAHESQIRAATFNPDGNLVATAATDGTARVWDRSTGEVLHDIVVSGDDRAQGIAFSADGSELLVSTLRGPVRIYFLDPERVVEQARSRIARGFSSSECDRYFAGSSCPRIEDLRG